MHTDSILKFSAILMAVVVGLQFDVDSEQGEARNGFIWEGGLADQLRKRFLSHGISIFDKLKFSPLYAAPPFTHFYFHCCIKYYS